MVHSSFIFYKVFFILSQVPTFEKCSFGGAIKSPWKTKPVFQGLFILSTYFSAYRTQRISRASLAQ